MDVLYKLLSLIPLERFTDEEEVSCTPDILMIGLLVFLAVIAIMLFKEKKEKK